MSLFSAHLWLDRSSLRVLHADEFAAHQETRLALTTAKTYTNLIPPLSRETLGHASWSMLHTIAALYPDEPSLEKQAAMRTFLTSLGELYPCATCAKHFRLYMKNNPFPTPLNKAALSKWFCESHNAVNVRLEKPQVDCSAEALDKRWPAKLEASCGCADEEEAKEKKEKEEAAAAKAAGGAVVTPASEGKTDFSAVASIETAASEAKRKARKEEEERDIRIAAEIESRRKQEEAQRLAQRDAA